VKLSRRGFLSAECHIQVAYKPQGDESSADWILHRVSCTEAEADLFREGQAVVLKLELEVS
jgi:hypothetical protein